MRMMKSFLPARASLGLYRPAVVAMALVVAMAALAPGGAQARAGSGGSFGSRGSRTYSAPPPTRTAPSFSAPIERSITPREMPPPAAPYAMPPSRPYNAPYAPSMGSSFMRGFAGGLIGAGLGGLLLGHGVFGGVHGVMGLFGLLFQIFLLVWLVRWGLEWWSRRQAQGGAAPSFGSPRPMPAPGGVAGGVPGGGGGMTLQRGDYEVFERILKDVQASWTARDVQRMQAVATPEMVGVFGEQLAELNSRGYRNSVSDVRLEQGDLSEAWSEGQREYATVAMRFSMIDVTRDAQGHVVDGDPNQRVTATELWTFLRARGGQWILSAIQQGR